MSNPTQGSELLQLLDIEFDDVTSTRVSGSAAADERHHQPWGIVHGGLYTAVIETFATTGAFEAVKDRDQPRLRQGLALSQRPPPRACCDVVHLADDPPRMAPAATAGGRRIEVSVDDLFT